MSKKRKKKYKLTKLGKVIVVLTIILFLCLLMCIPFFVSYIKLIGSDITLNYGDKYSEPGYKAEFLFKDVSNRVKVEDNLKEELGSYKVDYSFKFLFYNLHDERKVDIKDLEKPKIELKGNLKESIVINNNYTDAGYTATDNYDGDLTDKVVVESELDNKKLGSYKITYKVTDSSGNTGAVTREVDVVRPNPTTLSVANFTLEGFFDDVKLTKEKAMDTNMFNNTAFVGDSNIKNIYENGFLKAAQAWYKPCIHPSSYFNTKLSVAGTSMLLLDATKKYKPEYMIISFGTFSTTWIDYNTFIAKSNELIDKIKEASPNTKIILLALFPLQKGINKNHFTQDKINKYNYYILEMASKHKVKFIDAGGGLKGSNGYGKDNYYTGDGFHLNNSGMKIVMSYIKTHAWEE